MRLKDDVKTRVHGPYRVVMFLRNRKVSPI